MRIRGECLGIIGLGAVGTAVALRAKVFGFDVCYYDPLVSDGHGQSIGIKRCDTLQGLLHKSDCVTVHASLNEENGKMCNEAVFNNMRQVFNIYKF